MSGSFLFCFHVVYLPQQNLPAGAKVFRTMPNTPVVVQNGVTIHAPGTNVNQEDQQMLTDMLSSVGIGMEMQEHYMDIMTALSGGGPSFVSNMLSGRGPSFAVNIISLVSVHIDTMAILVGTVSPSPVKYHTSLLREGGPIAG